MKEHLMHMLEKVSFFKLSDVEKKLWNILHNNFGKVTNFPVFLQEELLQFKLYSL